MVEALGRGQDGGLPERLFRLERAERALAELFTALVHAPDPDAVAPERGSPDRADLADRVFALRRPAGESHTIS